MIPFAVVGSDQEYQVNGRRLLGRKTKWGTIEGIVTLCSLNLFREEREKVISGLCRQQHSRSTSRELINRRRTAMSQTSESLILGK